MSETSDFNPSTNRYKTNSTLLLVASFIIGLFVGMGIGVIIIEVGGASSDYSTAYYKVLMWDIYDDYSMAMRDMEAANGLIIANYYAQYLDYSYRSKWILESPNPDFFADDAMTQLDDALKKLTKINWPKEFKDDISQLQTYISELRQLVLRMQEIAHKSTYTHTDVENAEAILDSFHSYNDKIFDLIDNAP